MPGEVLAESLRAGLAELGGPALDDGQIGALLHYLDLLARWNRRYNLTAVREPSQMITRHVLDSLAVLPWIPSGRSLDAGTGAGLPGVPLAIARPESFFVLLDSVGKKIRFLNQVQRELVLENVEVIQARLESYRSGQALDCIVSRALSDLATFAGAARHLASSGTRLLAMKGRYPDSELGALPEWIRIDSVEALSVPGLHRERHLVIMSVIP